MPIESTVDRMVDLESRVVTLETRVAALAGIIAGLQPVTILLTQYGIRDASQQAVLRVIDEMLRRFESGDVPSFTEFEVRISDAATGSERRADRRFVELLIEALKLERQDATRLCEHLARAAQILRG